MSDAFYDTISCLCPITEDEMKKKRPTQNDANLALKQNKTRFASAALCILQINVYPHKILYMTPIE